MKYSSCISNEYTEYIKSEKMSLLSILLKISNFVKYDNDKINLCIAEHVKYELQFVIVDGLISLKIVKSKSELLLFVVEVDCGFCDDMQPIVFVIIIKIEDKRLPQ